MKAAVTVKENYEFRRIYRKGKSLVTPQMVLYWQKNRQGQSRLGITVSPRSVSAPRSTASAREWPPATAVRCWLAAVPRAVLA